MTRKVLLARRHHARCPQQATGEATRAKRSLDLVRRAPGCSTRQGARPRGRGQPVAPGAREHNRDTLLLHISDEAGNGWTTVAIDRATREWSIAQRRRQRDAAEFAYSQLYA